MMDRTQINSEDGLQLTADTLHAGNYLGDPSVVDQLVRDYLSACLSLLTDFETGDAGTAEEAGDRLRDLALSYAKIFMGESVAYVPQPWNHPNRLGFYLRAMKPPHLADYDRPADAYFAAIGTAAIQHAIGAEKKTISELEAQDGLAAIRNDAVAALLGTRAGASRA